jgi:TldD protein
MAAGFFLLPRLTVFPRTERSSFSPRTALSNPVEIHPVRSTSGGKIAVLREMDSAARSVGSVRSLTAGYFDSSQHIIVANSEGLLAEDDRVRTRVRLQTTVERAGRMLSEFDDFVGPRGFELFAGDYAGFARNQVVSMKARLAARPARSCVVPVVIEGGSGGVLWHEACGHPLEADNVVTGKGEFAGRIGQRVASPKVTLMDDGSIPGMTAPRPSTTGESDPAETCSSRTDLRGYLCDGGGPDSSVW